MRFQKYPDTCGRGLTFTRIGSKIYSRSLLTNCEFQFDKHELTLQETLLSEFGPNDRNSSARVQSHMPCKLCIAVTQKYQNFPGKVKGNGNFHFIFEKL